MPDNAVNMNVVKRGKNAPNGYDNRGAKGDAQTYNDLPGKNGMGSGDGGILGNRADPSRVGAVDHAIDGFGSGKNTFVSDDDSNFYNDLAGGGSSNNSGSGPGRGRAVDGFTNGGLLGGKV